MHSWLALQTFCMSHGWINLSTSSWWWMQFIEVELFLSFSWIHSLSEIRRGDINLNIARYITQPRMWHCSLFSSISTPSDTAISHPTSYLNYFLSFVVATRPEKKGSIKVIFRFNVILQTEDETSIPWQAAQTVILLSSLTSLAHHTPLVFLKLNGKISFKTLNMYIFFSISNNRKVIFNLKINWFTNLYQLFHSYICPFATSDLSI